MKYYQHLTSILCEAFSVTSSRGKELVESMVYFYRNQKDLSNIEKQEVIEALQEEIDAIPDKQERSNLIMCYNEYIVSETTVAGDAVFGTAAGIGQQGGSIGNVDFYAPGNALYLFGRRQDKKKKKGKKGLNHLYRRTFAEAVVVDEDSSLDCIIVSPKHKQIIKDVLAENRIDYIIDENSNIELHDTDDRIHQIIEAIQKVTTEAPFESGDITVMIGEFDSSMFKKPEKDFDEYDQVQLKRGIKVEMEHTTNKDIARIIACHHLDEDENYYVKLAKMEA